MSVKYQLIRFTSIIFSVSIIGSFFSVINRVIIANHLNTVEYSTFAQSWIYFTFFLITSTLSLPNIFALKYATNLKNNVSNQELISNVIIIVGISSSLSTLAFSIFLSFIIDNTLFVILISLSLLGYSAMLIYQSYLRSSGRIKLDSVLNIILPIIRFLFLYIGMQFRLFKSVNLLIFLFYFPYEILFLIILLIEYRKIINIEQFKIGYNNIKELLRISFYYFLISSTFPFLFFIFTTVEKNKFIVGETELAYYPLTIIQLLVASIGTSLFIKLPKSTLSFQAIMNKLLSISFVSVIYFIVLIITVTIGILPKLWIFLFSEQHELSIGIFVYFLIMIPIYFFATNMIYVGMIKLEIKLVAYLSVLCTTATIALIFGLNTLLKEKTMPIALMMYNSLILLGFIVLSKKQELDLRS